MSQILAFVIGGLTVLLGQLAAHRYSLARERRSEFAGVLDRTIRSFVEADSGVSHLIAMVGTGQGQDVTQAAADRVTTYEIDMRAALFSMTLRLPPGHPVDLAFREAQGAFTATYLALGEGIAETFNPNREARAAAAEATAQEALEAHAEFRVLFDAAMDTAQAALAAHDY